MGYRVELGKVNTDSNGRRRATYTTPADVPEGAYLSATATKPGGGVIEVKVPFNLRPAPPIITMPGATR